MSLLNNSCRKRARTSECCDMDVSGHETCVFRDFPRSKTAHLRFITSIYTRKYTPDDSAQRACPVLECPQEFGDKEAMCQHLYHCPHLTKGRYWCVDCRKAERISRFHCKRCPSRAASVAKKFFSLLGPKSHQGVGEIAELDNGTGHSVGEQSWSEFLERSETTQKTSQNEWGFSPDSNLPANGDMSANWNTSYSTQQFQADPPAFQDWNVPPYPDGPLELPNLPENSVCELPASYQQPAELVAEKPDVLWNEKDDWWLTAPAPESISKTSTQLPATHPQRFLTPINTQNLYQPTNQYHTPVGNYGLLSPSIISPLSPNSESIYYLSMPSVTVSPTDSEMSGQSLFTDSSYNTSTTLSSWNSSLCNFDQSAPFNSISSSPVSSGLTREFSFSSTRSSISPTDIISPIDLWSSAANTTAPAPKPQSPPQQSPTINSPNWSDTTTLSQFLIEILEQHLRRSKSILRTLPKNPIVMDLLDLSPSLILSIGLDAVASILKEQRLSTYMAVFSFTHLAYAAAVTVKDEIMEVDVERLFLDAVALEEGLVDLEQRRMYGSIARDIWRPANLTEPSERLDVSESREGISENRLVVICKHFLDVLESLSRFSSSNSPAPIRQLSLPHSDFLFTVKTQIISKLIQQFYADGFIEDLVAVEERAKNRRITNFRGVELALICVGMNSSQSEVVNEKFLKYVEGIFDAVYEQQQDKSTSRTVYQLRDVALLRRLIEKEVFIDDDLSLPDLDLEEIGTASSFAASIERSVAGFSREADNTLRQCSSISLKNTQLPRQPESTLVTREPQIETLPSSSTTSSPPLQNENDDRNKYRCHCGYTPKGDDKWKPSNLARHKRIQHSAPGNTKKVFECTFPGCGSTFNRSDNLGQHLREKGHFYDGFEGGRRGRGKRRRIEGGKYKEGEGGV